MAKVHANGSDQKNITINMNSFCGHINNVLCYWADMIVDPITKLRLVIT